MHLICQVFWIILSIYMLLKISSNCIQIAPENLSDTSHSTYHNWIRDADTDYLGSVKIVLSSLIGGNNFVDPGNTRKARKDLMNKAGTEAIHISNKYKVQIEPLHLEWDRFIPIFEKEFLDILNEMLGHNSQHQPLNSNKNRSILHRNREQYIGFGRGIKNRTRILTTSCLAMTHPNIANRFHHFSHSMPETLNTHNGNIISQTTLTKQLNIEGMHITPHHSEWWTHDMNNKAFTIKDHPGKIACFMVLFHMSTTIIPYTTLI